MNTYQEITAPDYASPAVAAYGKVENIYLTDDIVGEVTIKPDGQLFDFVDDLTGQPYELSQAERDAVEQLVGRLAGQAEPGLDGTELDYWIIDAANEVLPCGGTEYRGYSIDLDDAGDIADAKAMVDEWCDNFVPHL